MDYFLNRHDVVKAFHLLPKKKERKNTLQPTTKKKKERKNTLQNLRVCFAFFVNFQCNNIMKNANKCAYDID